MTLLVIPILASMALPAAAAPSIALSAQSDQSNQQIQQLQAQIAQLRAQMGSLGVQSEQASQAALAMAQQLADTQQQLIQAQLSLDRINQNLAVNAGHIEQVTAQMTQAQVDLASLIKQSYETGNSGANVSAVLQSQTLSTLIDNVSALTHTSSRMHLLVNQVSGERNQLIGLQASLQVQEQDSSAVVSQLQQLTSQQASESAALQAQESALTGQTGSLMAQIQTDQGKIADIEQAQAAAAAAAAAAASAAAARAAAAAAAARTTVTGGTGGGGATSGGSTTGGALPPFANGPQTDYFPWGQCTWYVASERAVTWHGNAGAWGANAAAQGYAEGAVPQVGAIVVFAPGGAYSSAYGHVGYVVAVQGPRSFTIDEDNFNQLGVPDQRHIDTLNGIEAFIY